MRQDSGAQGTIAACGSVKKDETTAKSMAYEQQIRVLHAFPDEYVGEFIVRFGHVAVPRSLDHGRLHDLPAPGPDAADRIAVVPQDLLDGVLFLVEQGNPDLDMAAVTAVQKEYLYRYYKEIVLPRCSPLAPAAEGVRRQTAPEVVRILNRLKNMPCTLRYPLAQKLEAQAVGKPALLLLPGPSLKKIAAVLPELARRHVVVAVSRTMEFCLAQGVQPDFVVQLDTYLIQRSFFERMPRMPHTTLVALSISPVFGYADKFKGMLFMDSFDTGALKNPYRLRENGLSTLMACMGLAECLHSPYALLVGADLSFPGGADAKPYFNVRGAETDLDAPACIQVRNGRLLLANRASRGVCTTLNYLAVAREAERFAREIAKTTGTRFYVGNDDGILCAGQFSTVDPAGLADAPLLDRTALSQAIDRALAHSEDIELTRLKIDCAKAMQALDQNMLFLDACRVQKTYAGLESNPLYLFAEQERDFNLPQDRDSRLAFAANIARAWRQAAAQAHNLVQAHIVARHKGAVPVICLPDEAGHAACGLEKLFPGFAWSIRPILGPVDSDDCGGGQGISYTELHRTLATLRTAFVTPAARQAYSYHFDVYGADNLYYLEPFTTE